MIKVEDLNINESLSINDIENVLDNILYYIFTNNNKNKLPIGQLLFKDNTRWQFKDTGIKLKKTIKFFKNIYKKIIRLNKSYINKIITVEAFKKDESEYSTSTDIRKYYFKIYIDDVYLCDYYYQ